MVLISLASHHLQLTRNSIAQWQAGGRRAKTEITKLCSIFPNDYMRFLSYMLIFTCHQAGERGTNIFSNSKI